MKCEMFVLQVLTSVRVSEVPGDVEGGPRQQAHPTLALRHPAGRAGPAQEAGHHQHSAQNIVESLIVLKPFSRISHPFD